jgi:DNA mismatch repair protein MutS
MEIRPQLSLLKDMERLYRRIVLQQLQPSELSLFLTSLQHIRIISDWCHNNKIFSEEIWDNNDHITLTKWIEDECNKWNMEEMNVQLHQLDSNVYKRGVHTDIDSLCDSIETGHQHFKNAVYDANKHMGQDFLKLEQTADKVYVLTMTTKRWETYLASNKQFSAQPYSSTNKNIVRITFPNMERIQNDITVQTNELRSLVKSRYLADLDTYLVYTMFMQRIVHMISTLDIGVTSAKNAFQFRYQRPIVVQTLPDDSSSFICAKQVRHPIIERVQSHLPYIANDVMIGKQTNGILLHGINASGKSSYMKSIGVNLVMAQAGMFVAAESWEFSPYLDLFTRIPGGDNLFKGHSTFVAEMVEVRSILTQSSQHSLVIGDELASGTESVSAISIVAAGIVTLAAKKASFLFATHLHEVAQLEMIKTISTIKVCHMSVHYDEERKTLLYDRIVKDGSGETLYGLEVCKSLDMPLDFLHLANTIRQSYLHIQPQLVQPTLSNYSSKVIVDVCTMCNKNKAMETHHIKEQHTADQNGFIGSFHKHVPHNLMSVCEECHDSIHHNKVKVEG